MSAKKTVKSKSICLMKCVFLKISGWVLRLNLRKWNYNGFHFANTFILNVNTRNTEPKFRVTSKHNDSDLLYSLYVNCCLKSLWDSIWCKDYLYFPTEPCIAPTPGYTLLADHYYKFVGGPSSYDDAKSNCESEKSQLAVVYNVSTDWDVIDQISGKINFESNNWFRCIQDILFKGSTLVYIGVYVPSPSSSSCANEECNDKRFWLDGRRIENVSALNLV